MDGASRSGIRPGYRDRTNNVVTREGRESAQGVSGALISRHLPWLYEILVMDKFGIRQAGGFRSWPSVLPIWAVIVP